MNRLLETIGISADRLARLRNEMAWVVTGQLLSFVGGFAGIKILTTVLGPQGYGELALGLTIAGLLNLALYGPASNVVARFFSICREREELGIYFSVLRRSHRLLAVGVALLAAVAGGVAWATGGERWGGIVMAASLFGIVGGINASYLALQNAVRQRKVVALHQGADVWLRVAFAAAFLLAVPGSGTVALLGYAAGTLFVTVSQAVFALRNDDIRAGWTAPAGEPERQRERLREFGRYAAPFVVWAGIAFVSIYGDRWVLQYLFGEREVGIYAALYQIAAAPVNLLVAVVNQLAVPIIFERAGSMTSVDQAAGSARLLNKTVAAASLLLLAVTGGFWLFGEEAALLLTSGEFAARHQLLWLLALGLSLFSVGQIMATKGLYYNRPRIYLWPKSIQTVSFLALSLWLGRELGITGVALSLCGSSLIHLVMVAYANARLESPLSSST